MALTVFVKGSNDHFKVHKQLGDCPSSHRILMILRLKGVHFTQEFVDVNKKDTKKWDEFVRRSQGRLKLPVLLHGDVEPLEDSDNIEKYLEETFPEPKLQSSNEKAKTAGRNLFSKFASFMRNSVPANDNTLRDALIKELRHLNEFLEKESHGIFLDGDALKLPDCNLLPKLMHVKVAGELKGFNTDTELENFEFVKKYLEEAGKQSAVKDTFTDNVKKDIKDGWDKKKGQYSTGFHSRR